MDLIVDVISIGEPWGISPGFAISDEWGHDRLDAYGGDHGWRELSASGFTSADLDEALHHSPCTTETLPDFFVLELFVVKGWGLGGKLMRSGLHRRGNPVIVLKLWHGGYPTLGKGKSSSHVPFLGDMLVPRRGSFFFSEKNPTQPNFKFWSFGGSIPPQNQLQKISSSQIRMDFRGNPKVWRKRQLSWEKIRCSWGYPIQITWVFMGRTPSYRSVSRFPLGEDPSDPPIPGSQDGIRSTFAYGHEAAKSNHLSVPWARKNRSHQWGRVKVIRVYQKCFTFGKEPTYHLFFVSPSFFLRPTVKFRVWFGMMWPISQCRNNTDWPPEEGLHHFATFCDPTIAVLCEHVKP